MILECAGCHQPYDVSSYKEGQRLRCQCGQVLVVPLEEDKRRTTQTLHCSNCGGALKKGDASCPFCNALVDLTDARLTAYCPSCLTMSREGAKFCSGCGKTLTARLDAPDEAKESCPHCQVKMRRREVGAHETLECPVCCGLFVEVEVLEQMIIDQEKRVGSEVHPGRSPDRATLSGAPVVYVNCPVCDTVMNRMNYGRISGVIVDYCRHHGYWLDAGELEKIARWVATGGLAKKYQREVEEAKAQKDRLSRTSTYTGATISTVDGSRSSVTVGSFRGGEPTLAEGLLSFVSSLFDY